MCLEVYIRVHVGAQIYTLFIMYAVVTSFLKSFNEFLSLNYKKKKQMFLKIFLAQQNYIINYMLSKLWIEYFKSLKKNKCYIN